MEQLIINNDYVHGNQLWSCCKSTLQVISNRDYPGKNYFKSLPSIDALDLDTYEKSLHKSSTECTVDAITGVALKKVGNKLADSYLLLVELRMGYQNGGNLKLEEIQDKVKHSKDILISFGVSRIYQNYFFIFTDKEAPCAKNKIDRKIKEMGHMTEYKVVSVSDFKNLLINSAELPYVPKKAKEDIIKSFERVLTSGSSFDDFWNYWAKEIEYYKNRYDLQEVENISKVLKDEISKAKRTIAQSTDLYIELEIIEEYLERNM